MKKLSLMRGPASRPLGAYRRLRHLGFRCTDCGNCCADVLVPVTAEDARRLWKGTGEAPKDFLAFYKPAEFTDGAEGLARIQLSEGPRVMGLGRRWNLEEGREACYFYEGRRCTAYPHRPLTCRNWPFDLALDAEGRLTRLAIRREVPCPYELDGRLDPRELVQNWKAEDREDRDWLDAVAKWNARRAGGSEEQFLRYLGLWEER